MKQPCPTATPLAVETSIHHRVLTQPIVDRSRTGPSGRGVGLIRGGRNLLHRRPQEDIPIGGMKWGGGAHRSELTVRIHGGRGVIAPAELFPPSP
jgi:hypothetical protein